MKIALWRENDGEPAYRADRCIRIHGGRIYLVLFVVYLRKKSRCFTGYDSEIPPEVILRCGKGMLW